MRSGKGMVEIGMDKMMGDGIFEVHWVEKGYAEYRLLVDTSEQMGESVRVGFIERVFSVEPTVTGFMVPRRAWEELMRKLCSGDE